MVAKHMSGMKQEAKRWESVVAKQKRVLFSAAFVQDWKKGGKLHTAAIKDVNFGVHQSLVQTERLAVLLRRTTKSEMAKFSAQDLSRVKIGAQWVFGAVTAKVMSAQGDMVSLPKPAIVEMCKQSVLQQAWSTDASFIAWGLQSTGIRSGILKETLAEMSWAWLLIWHFNLRSFQMSSL